MIYASERPIKKQLNVDNIFNAPPMLVLNSVVAIVSI